MPGRLSRLLRASPEDAVLDPLAPRSSRCACRSRPIRRAGPPARARGDLSASTAGVLLGFLAYGLFTVADAAVKAIGPALDIFQIGFLVMVFATPVMLAAKPASESWRAVLRPRRPGLVLLRGLLTTISGVCVVIAFTTIPFAEAFALLFLAPTIGTLLSRLLLKEPLDWHTMLAIGLGLAGVLIAIRPGLRVLEAGHLAAFVAAFSVGAGVSVLRKLSTT